MQPVIIQEWTVIDQTSNTHLHHHYDPKWIIIDVNKGLALILYRWNILRKRHIHLHFFFNISRHWYWLGIWNHFPAHSILWLLNIFIHKDSGHPQLRYLPNSPATFRFKHKAGYVYYVLMVRLTCPRLDHRPFKTSNQFQPDAQSIKL